jgi:D-alanyl-D-alanine carboxypeptidase
MRAHPKAVAVLLAAAACVHKPAVEPFGQSPTGANRAERMQDILDEAVERGMPAISAQVEVADSTWSGVSGVQTLEGGEPLFDTHRFRIASITKLFTEVAVLQLVDAGELSLDDTVSELLGGGALAGLDHIDTITVRQLIDHTSGMRDFTDVDRFWNEAYGDGGLNRIWEPTELLSYATYRGPYGEPGQTYRYSSSNYIVLGMILEKTTGDALQTVYRERLLEPLSLANTYVEGAESQSAGALPAYFVARGNGMGRWKSKQGWQEVRPDGLVNLATEYTHYNAWAWSAGAINTNAADLATFFNAVRSGALLSDESTAIVRGHSTLFDEGIGLERFSQSGTWDGIRSVAEEIGGDTVIVVLMNGTGIDNISMQAVFAALYAEAAAASAE